MKSKPSLASSNTIPLRNPSSTAGQDFSIPTDHSKITIVSSAHNSVEPVDPVYSHAVLSTNVFPSQSSILSGTQATPIFLSPFSPLDITPLTNLFTFPPVISPHAVNNQKPIINPPKKPHRIKDVVGSSCHQCKLRKTPSSLIKCTKVYPKKSSRSSRLCRLSSKFLVMHPGCLSRHYEADLAKKDTFICPCCRKICNCRSCIRTLKKASPSEEKSENDSKSPTDSNISKDSANIEQIQSPKVDE